MKDLRVLKFGGSSVGSPDKIQRVAKLVQSHKSQCQNIVVVVSAMGDTTDDLIALARQVSTEAHGPQHRREMDMLLTAGERISMSLLSMALTDLGLRSRSLTGSQSGVITDTAHSEARIQDIRPFRIEEHLNKGEIVIVAGFQGVSPEKEVTTLGRGGSDTSAVALGVALGADDIYIYTDVSGFFSADPRQVSGARTYAELDTTLAYRAASRGAQVLHPRCLELAAKFQKHVWIKNTFQPDAPGTLIKDIPMSLEGPSIKVISHQKDLSFVKAKAPSTRVLKVLLDQGLRPQHVQWQQGQLSFVLATEQMPNVKKLLSILQLEEEACVTISVNGYGFESHPEVLEKAANCIPEDQILKQNHDATSMHFVLRNGVDLKALLTALHELKIN